MGVEFLMNFFRRTEVLPPKFNNQLPYDRLVAKFDAADISLLIESFTQ